MVEKLQRKLEEPGPLREAAVEPTAREALTPEEAQPHHKEGDAVVADSGTHETTVGREGGRTDHLIDAGSGKSLPRDPTTPA